jgi:hypothetical protein
LLNFFNEWLTKHPRWAGLLLFLTTYTLFQGALSGQFVFDDVPQVLQNPFVTNPRYFARIFLGSVWSFRGAEEHDNFYRPLQFVVYWLLYRVAGPNPAVFHFFQLLFCAATVWLVYRLGQELFQNHTAAFAGALLWALHPQHVETVAWISALPDAGMTFFYVLGFWLFLRAEKARQGFTRRHALAALAYFPALFFKETALSFPLLILAYWFFAPSESSWKQKMLRWLPWVGAVAVYIVIRIAALGSFSQAPQSFKPTSRMVEGAIALMGQHAKLFFWPFHLSAFRAFDLVPSLHALWPWLTLLVLLAALWQRKREPVLTFLIAWWAVTLLPCLDIRLVGFPLADRFAYLPSVGPCLALAYASFVLLPSHYPHSRPARVVVPALLLVSSLWAVRDVLQIRTWHSNEALWTYSVQASPNSALPHLFQATLFQQRDNNLDGARREYETALRLNQSSVRPLVGIAYECYLGLGQVSLLKGRTKEAIDYYEQARQIAPSHSPAYKALGAVFFPLGDYAKAAQYFQQAVRLDPQDVETRFFLGTCLLKLAEPLKAAEQFRAARQVDPTYYQAFEAEARALDAAGHHAEATKVRGMIAKH